MGGVNISLPPITAYRPEPFDPVGQYQKVLSLRSLLGQQQIQQQQVQAGQQENQLRALQLQDQQTLRTSAKGLDWSKPDTFDKWIQNAQQQGVSPQTLSALTLQRAQYKEQLAKTDTATLAADKERANQLQGHIDAIKGIDDPAKRAQAAQLQASQILSSGLVRDPQATQLVQGMAVGKFVPTDEQLSAFENGLQDHTTQIDLALKSSETQKNTNAALLDQSKLDIMRQYRQNPQILAQQVNAAAPPAKYGDLNRRTMQAVQLAMSTGDVDGAKAAIKQASEEVGGIEKETNPAAQAAKLHLATAEKAAEQAIADGDPRAAAQLLVSGTVAPSQLISSRKPAFAQQAFTAAAQMQPGWTATKADADYKVASSPQQVAFFGSAKSLTDKGGTLDQLADAAKDIPSHQIPAFNTVADALKASTGSGPIAKYASIALGVADDYSKVMGGGQGSDTSRTQALNLITAKQSPQQRAASIEGIRGSVTSQINSRIGSNAVMRKMYGGELQSGGSSSGSRLNAQQLTGKAAKWGIAPVGAQ